MGTPSRSRRSSSSNSGTRAGNKSRPSSPRQPTGRRGSLKTTSSKTSTRSRSVESRSSRSQQKAKSKEGRPSSSRSKGRSGESEPKSSSSHDAGGRSDGSHTKAKNDDRKRRDSQKQVATESGSQDKAESTPRSRRRQSRFPRTSAGKITKARRRSSLSPSGAKVEEVLISPGGSGTSTRRKESPRRSPRLQRRLSVIPEESREGIVTRRRSSATGDANCLETQDVSLRGSLRENGFALKLLLKKSDAFAPERGGNVYVAHAVKLLPPRDVALKILRRDYTPRTRRQFFLPQEYYICRDLSRKVAHPNIVEFHPPLLLLGSRVCFPMERYSGGDLLELLYRQKKLSEADLRGYFSQAVEAVKYLHANEIAHLDLKCEHFLLDVTGNVRVCGFGWATKFRRGQLEEDIYCQTVGYTPPEVVRRHPYDPRKADVFALGVTLYILCTGKFPNPKLLDLTERAPNFPRQSEVSAELKKLIRAMMEADWSKRLPLGEVERTAWLQGK